MTETELFPIANFVNSLSQNWGYAIPSDNLWVIEIKTHARGVDKEEKSSFEQLYSNILAANKAFSARNKNTIWKISPYGSTAKFIGGLTAKNIKLFLANEVTYNVNGLSVASGSNGTLQNHGGFLSQGKILNSRSQDLQAKISFMVTNWDINEILIDPWIAAIAQQGLIEASTLPNIKADITIYEYAKGYPGKTTGITSLALRKEVTLFEAFPISREQSQLKYDSSSAGTLKIKSVDFCYRDYAIKYHLNF